MGVKLSDLVSGHRTIPVRFGEHTLTVTYRLSERTPERTAAIDVSDPMVKLIKNLVISWDLLDGNNKPIPITDKGLAKVPVPVMRSIWAQIQDDTGLGEVGSNSAGG